MDLTNVVLVIQKHWGRNFHYSVIGWCEARTDAPSEPQGCKPES